MKRWIHVALSALVLFVCTYLVWPNARARTQIVELFANLSWTDALPTLFAYASLMLAIHIARVARWHDLLLSIGARLPFAATWAISSVGFLAILAIPARLGEFVRPGLVRQKRVASASATLGTVAVERIVDGLLISLFVFGAFWSLRGPSAPGWMMPTAWAALGIFTVALGFLLWSLRSPERAVDAGLALTLLPRLVPKAASSLRQKLLDMVRGFAVIHDVGTMIKFVIWTMVYWIANGFCILLLARWFGLPLSIMGAFATMGLLTVGIMAPNPPGMVGQFQWFTMLGLSLYLGAAAKEGGSLHAPCLAVAVMHHLLQVVWYGTLGALGLASRHVSFADARRASHFDA